MSHVHRAGLLGALVVSTVSASIARAQSVNLPSYSLPAPAPVTVGAPSPDSLAGLVLSRFAAASSAAFDSVYPDLVGRGVIRTSVERGQSRSAGLRRVLWSDENRAVLLLSGTVRSGRSGELSSGGAETNAVRRFSGLYLAERRDGSWMLVRQVPIDTGNFIRAQTVHVSIAPGEQAQITDSLNLTIGTALGFTVRMNNGAEIASVTLDGKAATYHLGGGVLWIDAPKRARSMLVMRYALAFGGTSTDSAPAYGALDNTDGWLPFFGYDYANAFAALTVTATLPAEYRLTTSVPQTESVHDGVRTVIGRSLHPQFLLSLIYDRDWRPETTTIGDVRFETFLTPAFHFSHDSLAAFVARVYRVLVPRFGEPQAPSRYIALVEDRALHGSGFTVRMNNAVVSGDHALILDDPRLAPSSTLGHEVSHGWTMNSTGRAANFLQEGWATFAESLILRDMYGTDVEHAFWEKLRTSYIGGMDRDGVARGFEGRQSILGDPDNGRIHYFKGSWVLHSLNLVLGDSVFDRGMRLFITHASHGPNGYEEFIRDMSEVAGRDMGAFILPWLSEKHIPDVDARADGGKLIVTQSQPSALFDLPLDVALVTASGTVRRAVHSRHRADTIDVAGLGAISEVRVDPDHRFLLRRHWGDVAQFELVAPAATSVDLTGGFIGTPIPATRHGDTWSVEIPLTEGRYVYQWRVDGKTPTDEEVLAAMRTGDTSSTARVGIRVVRPAKRVPDADAR